MFLFIGVIRGWNWSKVHQMVTVTDQATDQPDQYIGLVRGWSGWSVDWSIFDHFFGSVTDIGPTEPVPPPSHMRRLICRYIGVPPTRFFSNSEPPTKRRHRRRNPMSKPLDKKPPAPPTDF